jgi:hypothetical protein
MIRWIRPIRVQCSTIELNTCPPSTARNRHARFWLHSQVAPVRRRYRPVGHFGTAMGHLWDRLIVVNTLFNKLSQKVSHCPSLQRATAAGTDPPQRTPRTPSEIKGCTARPNTKPQQRSTNNEPKIEPSLTVRILTRPKQ